ncbi:hypothetical protein B296_00014524, partial [Ensete ventricosum]
WKELPTAASSRCYLIGRRTHTVSPTLTTSLGASGLASGECASTNPSYVKNGLLVCLPSRRHICLHHLSLCLLLRLHPLLTI